MKTVIIIPYRDRERHLDYYLKHSVPALKKHIENLEVIIVEQAVGKKFNRGKTINIGYKYYDDVDNYYITQDVDVNPSSIKTFDMYKEEVGEKEILSIYSNGETLGGIIKFSGKTFKEINGFPNNYWGWGHEDKDLTNRVDFYKYKINRKTKYKTAKEKQEFLKKAEFFNIFEDDHNRQDCGMWEIPYKLWNNTSDQMKKAYIESNGISTLDYAIVKEEVLMEGVKKITVEI
jgi:hypothetical protein